MNVKILGTGCSKCRALEARLRRLAQEHSLEVHLEKVTDLEEIMRYGIMMTPGLVVNDTLKSAGTVPSDSQLLQWLKEGR